MATIVTNIYQYLICALVDSCGKGRLVILLSSLRLFLEGTILYSQKKEVIKEFQLLSFAGEIHEKSLRFL